MTSWNNGDVGKISNITDINANSRHLQCGYCKDFEGWRDSGLDIYCIGVTKDYSQNCKSPPILFNSTISHWSWFEFEL